jgi:peptide deformylase
MAETMYAAPGIGLAATQIDRHIRLLVVDISEEKNQLLTLINPRIVQKEGESVHEEGCLSVPGIYDKVTAPNTSAYSATNLAGEIASNSTQAACWRSASSMKSTISTARYSSNICRA